MSEGEEVKRRRRRSSQEIQRLVAEFRTSGLRASEFCRTRADAWNAAARAPERANRVRLRRRGQRAGRSRVNRWRRVRPTTGGSLRIRSDFIQGPADRTEPGFRRGATASCGRSTGKILICVWTWTGDPGLPGRWSDRSTQRL
jgi:hypothetical protein